MHLKKLMFWGSIQWKKNSFHSKYVKLVSIAYSIDVELLLTIVASFLSKILMNFLKIIFLSFDKIDSI